MNRRGFLGRMLAGAAAIVGAGMVAPKAEASEASQDMQNAELLGWVRGFHDGVAEASETTPEAVAVTSGGLTVSGNTTLGGTGRVINLGPGTYSGPIDLRGVSNVTIRGAGPELTTFVHPPTFEAMQADCAARGCRLEWWGQENDGPAIPTHYKAPLSESMTIVSGYHGPMFGAQINAWRRSLHQAGDERITLTQFRATVGDWESDPADVYKRWQAIDEARTESRLALGLPLSREPLT